ncbi:MAG: hypothetical protein H5T59_02775 [Anaerolineae bacterium]|nr:hypothetical protein [Anaerolineae bacterium]
MLEMVLVLAGAWLAVGLVIGAVLHLPQNLNRFQVALITWVLGSLLLAGGSYWVLSQDPPPITLLQGWREEVVRQVAADRAVLLEELPHPQMRVARFVRLDADADRDLEWMVIYTRQGSAGVRAYVYDGDVGAPGILYPYPLQTPDEDYLGDRAAGLSFRTADLVNLGRPQLIVSDLQTLSIFQVNPRPADPNGMVQGSLPRYEIIGFFRGDLVQRQGARVTVWQRDPLERSHLAVRRVYLPDPDAKTYFRPQTYELRDPEEESIGFVPGPPAGLVDSPYPETIVVAFYSTAPADQAQDYLVSALRDAYLNGTLDFGAPWPRTEVGRFLIKEVRYQPVAPTDTEATVTVGVVPLRAGQPAAGAPAPVLLRWFLVRQQGQWKMERMERL